MKVIVTVHHGIGDAMPENFRSDQGRWVPAAVIETAHESSESSEDRAIAIAKELYTVSTWVDRKNVELIHDGYYPELDVTWVRTRHHRIGDVFVVRFPDDDCEITVGLGIAGWVVVAL